MLRFGTLPSFPTFLTRYSQPSSPEDEDYQFYECSPEEIPGRNKRRRVNFGETVEFLDRDGNISTRNALSTPASKGGAAAKANPRAGGDPGFPSLSSILSVTTSFGGKKVGSTPGKPPGGPTDTNSSVRTASAIKNKSQQQKVVDSGSRWSLNSVKAEPSEFHKSDASSREESRSTRDQNTFSGRKESSHPGLAMPNTKRNVKTLQKRKLYHPVASPEEI